MQVAGEQSLYLDLPNTTSMNKNVTLSFLKDKMHKRVESWDRMWLSKLRKEVLLKSIAKFLPSYAMSVFLLPPKLYFEMEKIMCKYWWRARSNGQGRQGWLLLTHYGSLIGRIFQAQYYPHGSFLFVELGSNPSYVWRSIFASQELFKDGSRRRVVDGSSINILGRPWLLCEDQSEITSLHPSLEGVKVNQIMVGGAQMWDDEILDDLFNAFDQQLIKSIVLNDNLGSDH
ncbi:hypothetical protein CsatA_007667 [Cannabis sativa]